MVKGTDRVFYHIETSQGLTYNLFMKKRTHQFFESFFLNLFGVYANELSFYQFLKEADEKSPLSFLSKSFFPKVYKIKQSLFSSNFILLLEDVNKTRLTNSTKVNFPCLEPSQVHPVARVKAVLFAQAQMHAVFYNRCPSSVWGGNQTSRPPFLQLVARSTLLDVQLRFSDVISLNVFDTYKLFLDHYNIVRNHWSNAFLTTLVHGDSHLGNFYFEEEADDDGTIINTVARMYDFQCAGCEHPMRDVVYHVMSSVSDDVLESFGGDKGIVMYYLHLFNQNLRATIPSLPELSFDEAWHNYKLHACWVLAAWIISAGAGEKLFDTDKARYILGRISRACERVEVGHALHTFLFGTSTCS